MKLFSASILLLFAILRETHCGGLQLPGLPNIDLSSLSNLSMSSVSSIWNKPTSEASDTNAKGDTTEGGKSGPVQKETMSMKDRFQNMLTSHLPQVSDELQLQFLTALRLIVGSSFPLAGVLVTPLIDDVIEKYKAKVPNNEKLLSPDTTDALIFKLMSQKVDEKNVDEFVQIGAGSYLMKEVTSKFVKSFQQVADNYIENYMRDIKDKVEKKLTT